jgi:uncharacterized protein (TIGR00296 family)
VRLARRGIEKYLLEGRLLEEEAPEELRKPRGVFVTLLKGEELRGCIGFPFPTFPLAEATVKAAISSAFSDPRFPPLEREEMKEVRVEVSVLSPPEPIRVKDPKEYPQHVKVGRDGLIVEWRGFSGLLLPQVAVEWNWDPQEFLSQTCMKAGLGADCWLRRDVKISRFTAQIFSEVEPGGRVEERQLL